MCLKGTQLISELCDDTASLCILIQNKNECDKDTNKLCPKKCEICAQEEGMCKITNAFASKVSIHAIYQ